MAEEDIEEELYKEANTLWLESLDLFEKQQWYATETRCKRAAQLLSLLARSKSVEEAHKNVPNG